MSINVGDERKTSTINNLPLGFYYYLIPKNRINSATYLGFVDTIQSLTFNPFIEETDIKSVIDVHLILTNTAYLMEVYLNVIE